MSIEPPVPGEPRRGPRDPGDAWVISDTGERYWGRFGAAGLLAWDADRGVLQQHAAGESARAAALREAREEAGVPADAVVARFESVLDVGIWSYTTLVADVVRAFEPVISDPESHALAWVQPADVEGLPLHPGFAAAWPVLRDALPSRPAIVVDVANVMGSVPDGWWKDRAGAARRLVTRVDALAIAGFAASGLGLPATRWFAPVVAVTEGAARAADPDTDVVRVMRAAASGDDEIVAQAGALVASFAPVTVITSDRGLATRVEALGAVVRGTRWLIDQLD